MKILVTIILMLVSIYVSAQDEIFDGIKYLCHEKYPNDCEREYECYRLFKNIQLKKASEEKVKGKLDNYEHERRNYDLKRELDYRLEEIAVLKEAYNDIVQFSLTISGKVKGNWVELGQEKGKVFNNKDIKGLKIEFRNSMEDNRRLTIVVIDVYLDKVYNDYTFIYDMSGGKGEFFEEIPSFRPKSEITYKISIQSKGKEIAYKNIRFK